MKKLPKVYQNNIHKKITNNKEVCYLKNEEEQEINQDFESILDEVFNGIGYAYNIPLIITTSTRVYETSLFAKTKNNLITIDNEIIPIEEIVNIKKSKNS